MTFFKRLLLIFSLICLAACSEPVGQSQANKTLKSSSADVLIRLAGATESSGDIPGAEKLYLQAVKSSGDSPEALLDLAAFYGRNGQKKKGIATLVHARSQYPDNTDIARTLANAYINNDKASQALQVVQAAIEKDPKNPLLYNTQGVAYDILNKPKDAQASYQMAIKLDPDNATGYTINLALSYIVSYDYDKAIAILTPLLKNSGGTPKIRQTLALAYGLKGDSDKALELGLKDMNSEEAHENLKFYHAVKKKEKEAVSKKPATSQTSTDSNDNSVNKDKEEPETKAVVKPVVNVIDTITENPAAAFVLPPPVLKPDR